MTAKEEQRIENDSKAREDTKIVDRAESECSSSSAEEGKTIDVDFEFLSMAEVDFHGIKTLLKQMMSTDIEKVDISGLADFLISQPFIGSVVKCDGLLDPYAIMTAIDCSQECPSIQQLLAYLSKKAAGAKEVMERFDRLLRNSKVAILLNERLINMPADIAPPLLKSLIEEIDWATEDKLLPQFEYFVFITKVYQETISQVDDESEQVQSKKKVKRDEITYFFQQEDEIVEKYAIPQLTFNYKLPNQQSEDSRNAFSEYGIDPSRRVLILARDALPKLLNELQKAFE